MLSSQRMKVRPLSLVSFKLSCCLSVAEAFIRWEVTFLIKVLRLAQAQEMWLRKSQLLQKPFLPNF